MVISNPPLLGGLSPRVRGKPRNPASVAQVARSIPACAGEATAGRLLARIRRVYPRVCGGSSRWSHEYARSEGLSPRVRGKRPRLLAPRGRRRSIPACAGEAPGRIRRGGALWVYPRVCGGSVGLSGYAPRSWGLSPRVRGKHRPGIPQAGYRGSIPACAGEASSVSPAWMVRKVYPRVCGGSPNPTLKAPFPYGLSPRVRGKLGHSFTSWGYSRSIPACAGEAKPRWRTSTGTSVYPRVCGGSKRLDG